MATAQDLQPGDTFRDLYLDRTYVAATVKLDRWDYVVVTTTTGERFGYGKAAEVDIRP